jgi:hypothetical protein
MFILEAILAVLLFSVLWAVFASPFLAISFFIAKYMRKKLLSSGAYVLGLSLLTSIVVAPVPTPIITFFVPLISLLLNQFHTINSLLQFGTLQQYHLLLVGL